MLLLVGLGLTEMSEMEIVVDHRLVGVCVVRVVLLIGVLILDVWNRSLIELVGEMMNRLNTVRLLEGYGLC